MALLLTLFFTTFMAFSCSVALLDGDHKVVAHNLDWPYVEGIAIIHPRDESHQAQLDDQALRPLRWQSRYGTIIFHGSSPTQPVYGSADGMNEKGLFASILVMKRSQYPTPTGDTPVLDTTHWVQYVLDNYQSVEEVVAHQSTLQMVANTYKGHPMSLHLYIADKKGHKATLSYLSGQLSIHQDNNMPQAILTNDEYEESLAYLGHYQGFGGSKPLPGGYSSEARFVRVASFLKRLSKESITAHPIAMAFTLLNDSAEAPYTPMQTIISDVFDLTTGNVYFKSIFNQSIRKLDLNAVDFNRLDHPLFIQVHEEGNNQRRFNKTLHI